MIYFSIATFKMTYSSSLQQTLRINHVYNTSFQLIKASNTRDFFPSTPYKCPLTPINFFPPRHTAYSEECTSLSQSLHKPLVPTKVEQEGVHCPHLRIPQHCYSNSMEYFNINVGRH